MRRIASLIVAPAAGAVALIAWAETSSGARLETLWSALQDGFLISYAFAACAAWPTIAFVRRVAGDAWRSWVPMAVGAGAAVGLVSLGATLVWLEGIDDIVAPDTSEVARAAFAGLVLTVPAAITDRAIRGGRAKKTAG